MGSSILLGDGAEGRRRRVVVELVGYAQNLQTEVVPELKLLASEIHSETSGPEDISSASNHVTFSHAPHFSSPKSFNRSTTYGGHTVLGSTIGPGPSRPNNHNIWFCPVTY
jgi:hypothetical protein